MVAPEEDFLRLPSLTVGKQRAEGGSFEKSEPASPYIRIKDNLEHLLIDEEEKQTINSSKSGIKSSNDDDQKSEKYTHEPILQSDPKKTTKNINSTNNNSNSGNERKSLWVGNLDPELTEDEVWEYFSKFGILDSLRVFGGRECAFVNYVKKEDAVRAKESLHLTPLGRTIIKIKYSREGDVSDFSTNGSNSSLSEPFYSTANNSDLSSRSIWVGHLGPEVDVSLLQEAFSRFGRIETCRMLEIKNCAFVNFFTADDAARARKEMNGVRIGNSIIRTGYAKSGNKVTLMGVEGEKSFAYSINKRAIEFGNRVEHESEEPFVTKVASDEFNKPLPIIPAEESTLPEEFNGNVIRECRRRIEHATCVSSDVDQFAFQVMKYLVAASIDPIGNILVQKLVERGSAQTREAIIHRLGPYMATIGIHKNGTWVIQRIINSVDSVEQCKAIASYLHPHVTPLMQDQFGNYVVQCCLAFGPDVNRFIFEALYHRCIEIGTSRFGSRAMRSCLESPHSTIRQCKFVATAIISVSTTLATDQNGVIVLQWFLDSDLPGKYEFLGSVLKGHYAELALCKHGNVIVAKMTHPSVESSVREAAINELFSSPHLSKLLQDTLSAAILLRCLLTVRTDLKQKLARRLGHLLETSTAGTGAFLMQQPSIIDSSLTGGSQGSHLDRMRWEVEAILGTESLLNTEAETKASELFSPTLITQAVGGPVTSKSATNTRSLLLPPSNAIN